MDQPGHPASAAPVGRLRQSVHGSVGSLRLQETLREKKEKYKAQREKRRRKMDALYQHMCAILAFKLDLALDTVEELLLDMPSFQDIDDFFSVGGRRSLLFFYQEAAIPGIECGRTFPGASKEAKIMRLFLGNIEENFKGLCLFFVRCTNDTLITGKNIQEEIHFSVLDATEGLLSGIHDLLSRIFYPAVNATNNWGALNKSEHLDSVKGRCMEGIAQFLSFLAETKACVDGALRLKQIVSTDFSKLRTFEDCTAAALDPEMVSLCEGALMAWHKQIEQVLVKSELIRKETDLCGPLMEVEYWKKKSLKYSFIIEQIKGQSFRSVVNVLNLSGSKQLEMWKALDVKITDVANEAKDNVKFLSTLEQACQPLYSLDLVCMAHSMQNLMNAVRMIQRFSRYYNTPERMTSLFSKVTNQMITACKAYITEKGTKRIWDLEGDTVTSRIQDCIFLFSEYQNCFHRTQERSEEEEHMQQAFGVSEMNIFRKFQGFCQRIEKIKEMLSVIQSCSPLSKCTIEGVGALNVKYKSIYQDVKAKSYDVLDTRRIEFDSDFTEFMTKMNELEAQIRTLMTSCFDHILSIQQAVQLLQSFQKCNIPCLKSEIPTMEGRILQHYMQVLKETKKVYQRQKENPPLARNMPPVSGKILWSRLLFQRINEPITYLSRNSNILSSSQGKAAVRLYNNISIALVEFEVLYHKAWLQDTSQLQYALQATLLVRHPETKQFFVNFDAKYHEILKETKCIMRLGLDVPAEARKLLEMERELLSNHGKMQSLIKTYKNLCGLIPPAFVNLMADPIKKVESVLQPGLAVLTWSSLRLDSFFEEVDESILLFSQLVKQMNDICEVNIHQTLREMEETAMIVLPDDGPASLQQLLAINKIYTACVADYMNQKSQQVEQAVKDLIAIFQSAHQPKCKKKTMKSQREETKHVTFLAEAPQDKDFIKECKEIHSFYNQLLVESLQRATRLSLEFLRRQMLASSSSCYKSLFSRGQTASQDVPLLKAEVHLIIPDIVIIPSLDSIQQAINHVVQFTLDVSRGVTKWKRQIEEDAASGNTSSTNLYSNVAEHQDVCKLIFLLFSSATSPMNLLRSSVVDTLQDFHKFNTLWAEDRESKIKQFIGEEPSLSEIKAEILLYVNLQKEIEAISPLLLSGFLEIDTAPLKSALCVEAKAWKTLLCRYLYEEYKVKVADISSYITERLKKLSCPILDLEDVRLVMETLAEVRENEIRIDMTMGPVEVRCFLLQ